MIITPEEIICKAKAFVDTLSKLPRSQYSTVPNGQFGQDYNLLRSLTLEALPHLDPRLIGKEIEIRRSAEGAEVCTASYVEIETFARQIMEHSDDNPAVSGRGCGSSGS